MSLLVSILSMPDLSYSISLASFLILSLRVTHIRNILFSTAFILLSCEFYHTEYLIPYINGCTSMLVGQLVSRFIHKTELCYLYFSAFFLLSRSSFHRIISRGYFSRMLPAHGTRVSLGHKITDMWNVSSIEIIPIALVTNGLFPASHDND